MTFNNQLPDFDTLAHSYFFLIYFCIVIAFPICVSFSFGTLSCTIFWMWVFLFSCFNRALSHQCEQTRSHGKFLSSPSSPNLCRVSSWAASCPSAASSSSSSSSSTAFGMVWNHIMLKCVDVRTDVLVLTVHSNVSLQVSSDVLHVWLPFPGLHHPAYYLLRGNCSALLLPFMCRGEIWHLFNQIKILHFTLCVCVLFIFQKQLSHGLYTDI